MKQPVFIVGCPRSGTTLMSVILDRHSQLAVTPETAFYDEIAPQLSPIDKCDLRRVLGDWPRLPELGLSLDQVVRHCGISASPARLMSVLLESYAQDRQKSRCGEKTPQHLRHIPHILRDFPDAQILCLIRDGRDVALSLSAMPWWRGDLRVAADTWLGAVRLAEGFAAAHPTQFFAVRYERLVADPEAVVATVMRFLGLQFEGVQLEPSESNVVLRRSMAWKGSALGPIEATRTGVRRLTASPEDLDYLKEALGPTLKRLGYCD